MKIWIVHAFTDRVFTGNPAAVVPLERWLPDAVLQAIATENKLSETAFVVPTGLTGNYQLRWFSPTTEVPLCGHATLAAGAVLLSELAPNLEIVVFDTHAGALVVRRTAEGYTLDLPRKQRTPWTPDENVGEALGGVEIYDAFIGEYANIVLESETALRAMKPDIAAINRAVRGPRQGMLVVSAPADEGKPYDFVQRFFCPSVGVDEDHVTGSAFADAAPYWCDRLDLESVVGFQASKRGGYMRAVQTLSSVRLLGQVAVYLRGELDSALSRIHNRIDVHPEAPQRKKRRPRAAKQLPAIFEDPMLPGLEVESPPDVTPAPPTSHPAPPEEPEAPPAPRIVVTGEG
ncbi:MAG TPA: PhzF family phenazine biosynthesis protein [Vitreimonas sp.]|uniref:PhzF family phenazine biosynthesis protein n=1 Tax=Vitreimonas sp. TaxID=3069702 RepID=UPI002D23B2D0|nr:PhzF family phenazine biosynthesis protein [Vitreimonas sp.]HYD86949.1 PhzF family phenazine biosynthesis protein [Vitreimonas sp.]